MYTHIHSMIYCTTDCKRFRGCVCYDIIYNTYIICYYITYYDVIVCCVYICTVLYIILLIAGAFADSFVLLKIKPNGQQTDPTNNTNNNHNSTKLITNNQ